STSPHRCRSSAPCSAGCPGVSITRSSTTSHQVCPTRSIHGWPTNCAKGVINTVSSTASTPACSRRSVRTRDGCGRWVAGRPRARCRTRPRESDRAPRAVIPDDDRMMRIAVAFARATATPWAGLCSACVDVLDVSGAGITMMAGAKAGPLCVSDSRMATLEDMQFTAGEGPCRDAFDSRLPVSVVRLDGDASRRWPAFVDLAVTSGIGSVFAYPLSASGVAIGVLTLYQDEAGALSDNQHDDSVVVAEVLTETLFTLQAAAPDG